MAPSGSEQERKQQQSEQAIAASKPAKSSADRARKAASQRTNRSADREAQQASIPGEEFKQGNGTARELGAKKDYVALAQASVKPEGEVAAAVSRKKGCKSALARNMSTPGVEPGLSRPQRDVLTTRRCGPCGGVPDNAGRSPKTVPKPTSTQSQPQDSFGFCLPQRVELCAFFCRRFARRLSGTPHPPIPPLPRGGGGMGGWGVPSPPPPPPHPLFPGQNPGNTAFAAKRGRQAKPITFV